VGFFDGHFTAGFLGGCTQKICWVFRYLPGYPNPGNVCKTLMDFQMFPVLYNGLRLSPPHCPVVWGDKSHIDCTVSSTHPSPKAKRHLDCFNHFITGHG